MSESTEKKEVAVVAIHGMGTTTQGYSEKLFKELRKLCSENVTLYTYEVLYQTNMQRNESRYFSAVRDIVDYRDLREFVLYGFGDAAGIESYKHMQGSPYTEAQLMIASTFNAIEQAHTSNIPIVVIAQSLGCQVFSCYMYDAQKYLLYLSQLSSSTPNNDPPPLYGFWSETNEAVELRKSFDAINDWNVIGGRTVRRFITTGCNIPIFTAAHPEENIVPFTMPNAEFTWINLYDRDDVLGWPLQPLSEGYRAFVRDEEVNVHDGLFSFLFKSWNPMSHSGYWDTTRVLKRIASEINTLFPNHSPSSPIIPIHR